MNPPSLIPLEDDPIWYKNAVIYELHLRAFYDGEAQGHGNFKGLTEKLDYLKDLGVTALWLLPFYPSPLRDDGYDIADYKNIHPAYGTLNDFKVFLKEAHKRRLKVITELVVNHTSDQHPWFQRAKRAKPGSAFRNYYVWNSNPDRYPEARIIFQDFETSNWSWDPIAQSYYWHRFYSHQPDLNYDNPKVRQEIFRVVDFWLELGVDGLRLDAVPYLYERDGTHCENLPQTHEFLKELRHHIEAKFKNRMLLAEANQWPEEAVSYFGAGDECHMAFHFPLMPRLFMGIRMEDRFSIVEILKQTPSIPANCQWALFLRNHDELTLEMVTDEERDYMVKVYATDPKARINLGIRRRLAPLLENDRRKIELMNGLLFSLPGTPVVYYGDEIGMGDNIYLGDRNGVRTPMQWSVDRNAGFSRANPQSLYLPVISDPEYHPQSVNVESQLRNSHSLLWWMRRMIAVRKQFRAFGEGELHFLYPQNRKILAFIRSTATERILALFNLSRFTQYAELDLSAFKGMIPHEIFGDSVFPAIGELPYFITLGPHSFYWFSLQEPQGKKEEGSTPLNPSNPQIPVVRMEGEPDEELSTEEKSRIERVLPSYLKTRRWFGGKAHRIRSIEIQEAVFLGKGISSHYLVLLQVFYSEREPDIYLLPLAFSWGEKADQVLIHQSNAVIAKLQGSSEGVAHEPLEDREFHEFLFTLMRDAKRIRGLRGYLVSSFETAQEGLPETDAPFECSVVKSDQSNSSFIYNRSFILKLFRRLEPGLNPELEIGRFLTEKNFASTARVRGALEYVEQRQNLPTTCGILHEAIPNEGDAWRFTLDLVQQYFDRALKQLDQPPLLPPQAALLWKEIAIPQEVQDQIGVYLEWARLLGKHTAEMHQTLASSPELPEFAPERFTRFYQRSLYQSFRSLTLQTLDLLETRLQKLPPALQSRVGLLLSLKSSILSQFEPLLTKSFSGWRIRCHGDYHLGQLLYTGKDFIIIDFEGEPSRPLSDRRRKRSPLRDLAGMLRSFDYVAHSGLFQLKERGLNPTEERLKPWVQAWIDWVSVAFIQSYRDTAGKAPFLPQQDQEIGQLLDLFILEKVIFELGYELNHRPHWLNIPIEGILRQIRQEG